MLRFVPCLAAMLAFAVGPASVVAQTDPDSLSGLTFDDQQAELVGDWTPSTSVKPYLGESYIHDSAKGKGEKAAKFTFRVPVAGDYHLLVAYTPGGNRAKKVPLAIESVDGTSTVVVDQTQPPQFGTGFHPVGKFTFSDMTDATVLVETAGTTQHVIVDGIRLLTPAEFKLAEKEEKQARPPQVVAKKKEKKPAKPKPKPPQFTRNPPAGSFEKITPEQFDRLIAGANPASAEPISDSAFLRRLSLDLIGRQPSLAELEAYGADDKSTRREQAVERLLASESFGRNWGNYWSDVIAARQAEPQLTYLNYKPFRAWLADRFNQGAGWDETAFQMITAIGMVGDGPEGAFIGFHQGERNKLAGESARVFLGLRIGCAQCHDHPFVDMPQQTFHGMAAFFARTKVKLPWNDSNQIEISSADKGEHKMPGAKGEMAPTVYRGDTFQLGLPDLARREKLAYWLVSGDNPYFAHAFVNHIQARLMGRGFFHPIDNLGDDADVLNPAAHHALAGHFVASGFDVKSVFRLLVSTRAYQSEQPTGDGDAFSGAKPKKLRGDEVFDSLAAAIDLPNIDTKVEASTDKSRFPPPAKSTRDLVNEAFGFDPSTRDELLTRTMKQAIFMMNNKQLHQQIKASPDSDTVLSRLLKSEPDDDVVIDILYTRALARKPTSRERKIVQKHVESIDDRGQAFEDVLWSLLNSAEFTTRE